MTSRLHRSITNFMDSVLPVGERLYLYSAPLQALGLWRPAFFSKTYPTAWAFLTFICQLVLAYQPFSSFSKREAAAEYIFEDLQILALEAEEKWDVVKGSSDGDEVKRLAYELRKRQDAIEGRFATVDTFPMNELLHWLAQKKTNNYFRRFEQ